MCCVCGVVIAVQQILPHRHTPPPPPKPRARQKNPRDRNSTRSYNSVLQLGPTTRSYNSDLAVASSRPRDNALERLAGAATCPAPAHRPPRVLWGCATCSELRRTENRSGSAQRPPATSDQQPDAARSPHARVTFRQRRGCRKRRRWRGKRPLREDDSLRPTCVASDNTAGAQWSRCPEPAAGRGLSLQPTLKLHALLALDAARLRYS